MTANRGPHAFIITRDRILGIYYAGEGRDWLREECDAHSEEGHGEGDSKANLGFHAISLV